MGSLAMEFGGRVPAPAHRAAYRAQQSGMLYNCLLGHRVLRLLTRNKLSIDKDAESEVQQRYEDLIALDLQNVEDGMYPKSLLFQFPFMDYIRSAPALALDVPRAWWRMRRNKYQDLPDDVDLNRYPKYFRRNFHWQTDGYFSRHSADIYDIAVEFLFLGTADVMRRMVIPPITRHLGGRTDARVLDVACGTGRFLHQLAVAHPRLRLFGLDLSPYYIQHARELLTDVENLSLIADNAEQLPFVDGYFDVVTSIHLFHELPHDARRNVYREMLRVLQPGGLLVIEDSAQLQDNPNLGVFLKRFSREFHEPYHKGYLKDDIAKALTAEGFEVVSDDVMFVSKVVVARKPAH